jgi:hypothetical protein
VLGSLSLDPETVDAEFIQVKYHKDQASDKNHSHVGMRFSFKKWRADQVKKYMNSNEVEAFIGDKDTGKEHVRTYGDGKGDAPVKNF